MWWRGVGWLVPAAAALLVGCTSSSDPVGSSVVIPMEDVASSTSTTLTGSPANQGSTTTSSTIVVSSGSSSIGGEGLLEIAEDAYPGGTGAVMVGVFHASEQALAAVGLDGDGNPVTTDRSWRTASLAKVFTAVAVLSLVDAGLIELDMPAADYVDFPMSDRITVRHLLQHQSTIPDISPFGRQCHTEFHVEQIVEKAAIEPSADPGVRSSYSNTNYLILGFLVGQVTGEDSGEFMKKTIFEPLGMRSTYWFESQQGPAPWSSQQGQNEGQEPICGSIGPTIGTDGSAVTSLEDMDRFFRGLFGGQLLSEASLNDMVDVNATLFNRPFGLGLVEMTDPAYPDDQLFGFGGTYTDFDTAAFHDPTKSRTVVVFTTTGDQVGLLWEAIEWANQNE